MSPSFDPYHKWLGIPAHESPPNYYRLLGIALFESDPDVIQNAMDQRMAHLKSFATGPHVDHSQRLLNEVARAGVCLLRPVQKLSYDTALRAATGASEEDAKAQSPSPPVVPVRQESPLSSEPDFFGQFDKSDAIAAPLVAVRVRTTRGKQRPSSTRSAISIARIILAGVIGLAAGCFVLFMVNPTNPLIEKLVSVFHSSDKAAKRQPPPRSSLHGIPKPGNRSSTPRPSPLGARPKPENPQPPFPASRPDKQPKDDERKPSPDSDNKQDAPKATATPPTNDILKEIILDLSHSVTFETLPKVANGDKVEVWVESVTDLGTLYELRPDRGVLRFGQAVDIVLPQYPGIHIRLSLPAKDGTIVKVTPAMDIERGTEIEFTRQRVQRASVTWKRDANALNQQLLAARNEAQNTDLWLKSPGTKPLQLRSKTAAT